MRWLLWNVDWSLENNRIHCSSGASLQATGLAHEMHGRRQLPQGGLVPWAGHGGEKKEDPAGANEAEASHHAPRPAHVVQLARQASGEEDADRVAQPAQIGRVHV